MDTLAATFASQGFAVVDRVIESSVCDEAARMLERQITRGAGSRRLLEQPWCQELARQVRRQLAVNALLSEEAVAVQCILFDKSPTRNWLVPFHQDRSIPVRGRVESAELMGWSEKEGDIFVQPPAPLLEQFTAIRLHIDPCPAESGPLRVVPGSHLSGILSAADAERIRNITGEKVLPSPRGGALLLRPLLLHASSKAEIPTPRRVLHFVFGPRWLPFGLAWRHAV